MTKRNNYISEEAEKIIKEKTNGVTCEDFSDIYSAFKDVNNCLENTNHILSLDYDSEVDSFVLYDNDEVVTNYIDVEDISQEVYATLGILLQKEKNKPRYTVLYASKYSDEDSIYVEYLGEFDSKEKAISCVEKCIKQDMEENENCKFIQDKSNGTWISEGRLNDYHLMTYKIQKIR